MKVGAIVFFHNMLTLQTLILYKVQHVMGTGTFSCLQQSNLGQSLTRVTFLGEEDAGLLLYTTFWSQDMRLLTCEIQSSPLAIADYSALCNTSNADERLTQMIHALISPNSPCAKIDAPQDVQSASKRAKVKLRRKRSWIFPGTLWCGTGSKAFGFDELGMFERADQCCREHDHCLHIIPAFTVNYGVFNPNFYTVSHCDCDERFRQCLLDVNDTISSMVLYSFFKMLKVPCFELQLRRRCTELYWWGMCKVTQEAPYAVFKKPIYYNISFTSASEKSDGSESTASKLHQFNGNQEIKLPRRKLRPVEKCISQDPPRGDTFYRMKTNGCRKRKKNQATVAQDTTPLKTDIMNKGTKGLQSLSVHSAALITAAPYVKATYTTSTTAPASKRLSAATTSTTSRRSRGRKLSAGKSLQSQNQKSPLTTTLPAGTPTEDLASTRTPFVHYYDITTTADPFTHYLERKIQSQGDTVYPEQEVNDLTNSEEMDAKQNKSLLNNRTDVCEMLKHLDKCSYKIPPKKKRFGLKNLDTKPAYHCDCTKRLALEIESLKQLSVHSFLVHSVSENCFRLPKRNKCRHKKSCSGVFSKASDLLQALKKIEQNDIAGVRNSAKLRKGRIFVQLYKRCLRLRKDVMAPLT